LLAAYISKTTVPKGTTIGSSRYTTPRWLRPGATATDCPRKGFLVLNEHANPSRAVCLPKSLLVTVEWPRWGGGCEDCLGSKLGARPPSNPLGTNNKNEMTFREMRRSPWAPRKTQSEIFNRLVGRSLSTLNVAVDYCGVVEDAHQSLMRPMAQYIANHRNGVVSW